jgi:hypothetical protein
MIPSSMNRDEHRRATRRSLSDPRVRQRVGRWRQGVARGLHVAGGRGLVGVAHVPGNWSEVM